MREILFRGKRIDNGEWVYGYYIEAKNRWHKYGVHKEWIACSARSNGGWFCLGERHAIISETAGQFTGLTDKNGTKIFEGDIVTAPYIDPIFHSAWNEGNPTENVVVKYADGVFYIEYIESKHKITLFGLLDGEKEAEVIGNVHDNPELLNVV